MRQAALAGITAFFLVAMMPVLLLKPQEEKKASMILVIEEPETAASESIPEEASPRMVRLQTGGAIRELPLEEYLVGVVLAEMPASFEPEALKAQAVAARTFTLRQCEGGKHREFDLCSDPSCCQAWTEREAMERKLGNSWEVYWRRGETAVRETAGEILTYAGEKIDAVYFSCSGGQTEDAIAVWGTDVPYLQSVSSPGEELASRFESTVTLPIAEFQRMLQSENNACQWKGEPADWLGEVVYTAGGGVASMELGGQVFSGTDLRKIFQLNSTCFQLTAGKDRIEFDVRGFGHRVGMSQYGANAMAHRGCTYREILQYYYTDVTVEREL